MALVLEMPAGEINNTTPPFIPNDPITTATAETAADLLERGEAEGEGGIDVPIETVQKIDDGISVPKETGHESPPLAETNGKPKRKRKPKGEKGIELSADPAPAGDQLKSPSPELVTALADLPKIPSVSQRRVEISATEGDYVRICLQIQDGEDLIEETKGELKILREKSAALASRLRHLRNDEAYQPSLPLMADPSTAPLSTTSTPTTATETGSTGQATTHAGEPVPTPAVAAPVDPPSNPDAWRTVSIDDLGLPPSITAKLIEDSISTLGQLEDLRGEISQRRQKWPKGIGLAKITLIEDAVVKWLTKNRDREAFAGVSQPAVTQDAANAEVTVKHPAQSHDAPPAAVFEGAWEDLTEDQQRDYIARRADAINDGSPSCLDRKHPTDDSYWAAGYRDFNTVIEGENRNCELRDCIYTPGDRMDDWIRGFLAAKAVEDYPTGKGKEPASQSPPPEQQSLGDIDDI